MLMFASISVSDIIQVENIKYRDKMEKARGLFFVYSIFTKKKRGKYDDSGDKYG